MDLRLIENAVPSAAEREAIDRLLGPPSSAWRGGAERRPGLDTHVAYGGHALRSQRHMLLPALHAIRDATGYISPGGLNYVCQRLDVPPADAYGVASFYALFSLEEQPPVVAHVCDDIACRINGALGLCQQLEDQIGPEGTPSADGKMTWVRSPCLGQCNRAPVALIQRAGLDARDETQAPTTGDAVLAAMAGEATPKPDFATDGSYALDVPQLLDPDADLYLLRRIGRIDPENIDSYRAAGGYEALRRAFEIGPEGVIREVEDSKIVGRGGAAFPKGRKLGDVARAPARPHYLVCNADESEPGTFKDRVLMEGDPFALIESMTIAGYAAGCEQGFIYIRGEYPRSVERLQHAIDMARQKGFLGRNIMGKGYDFDIEIRRGAGAYICGEETALFSSLEGYRGEPRSKPPFPTQVGLFGKPTLVSNVETLMNLPRIVLEGGPAYAAIGTEQSTGTKLFCLSGCIQRPGIYEFPFGVTLREVLEAAGGVPEGRELRAVLVGGAASSFVTPDELDMELTFEGTRAAGAALGSAVIMPFDDSVDMTDIILRIAAFFRDESCGQCVPCRVGTVRQQEALQRLVAGRPLGSVEDEIRLIDEVAQVMRDASICGLGHTAPIAVQSAIHKLHLFNGRSATT
ncbi:MAG TPA: NAD(P)H-dependent oxidoreductase subunit E [Thermomicrobiales bacterium]|nr:NAD(P)H-dependent oxidoreductase subunit E [Thermomicrobiales bacterium]